MTAPTLHLCATSFLPPRNKAWQALAEQQPLQFADYGNWSGRLMTTPPDQPLAVVVFLDDLDVSTGNAGSQATADDAALDGFLQLLATRLSRSTAATVVALSAARPDSVLRSVRGPTPAQQRGLRWHEALAALCADQPQLLLLDLDRSLADIGHAQAFDRRNWYLAHCRLSPAGLAVLARDLGAVLARSRSAAAKVLVLDCDNTLWGGVVGEDGVNGLALGQDGLGTAFVDFQRQIQALAQEGVLLVLCSKNNEADVWEVFDQHPAMRLRRADIVGHRINWQDKASNIAALAQELDLGLDSFVFWDDNPMERDRVRQQLPQVRTIEAPADVTAWPALLAGLDCLAKFSVTADDKLRTAQYRSRARFIAERNTVLDEAAYLRSIALQATAVAIGPGTLARAAQLCQKTNQYNLRTQRHGEADLSAMLAQDPQGSFLVSLKDCYGDHGIVGLVCLRTVLPGVAFLDTFLMSCRVLGRHLEAWMLGEARRRLVASGCTRLLAEFVPTAKNVIAAEFLASHGFAPVATDTPDPVLRAALDRLASGGQLYVASLADVRIPHLEVYPE